MPRHSCRFVYRSSYRTVRTASAWCMNCLPLSKLRAVGPGAPFEVKSEVAEARDQAPRDDEHHRGGDVPRRRLSLHARLHSTIRVSKA